MFDISYAPGGPERRFLKEAVQLVVLMVILFTLVIYTF